MISWKRLSQQYYHKYVLKINLESVYESDILKTK